MTFNQLPLKDPDFSVAELSTPNLCLDRRAVAKFGADGVVAGTGASASGALTVGQPTPV